MCSEYMIDWQYLLQAYFEQNEFFSPKVNQSKRKMFLSTCPSDKHYGCPIPKSSYPKSFARFLSQMELVKTNEMVAV